MVILALYFGFNDNKMVKYSVVIDRITLKGLIWGSFDICC